MTTSFLAELTSKSVGVFSTISQYVQVDSTAIFASHWSIWRTGNIYVFIIKIYLEFLPQVSGTSLCHKGTDGTEEHPPLPRLILHGHGTQTLKPLIWYTGSACHHQYLEALLFWPVCLFPREQPEEQTFTLEEPTCVISSIIQYKFWHYNLEVQVQHKTDSSPQTTSSLKWRTLKIYQMRTIVKTKTYSMLTFKTTEGLVQGC